VVYKILHTLALSHPMHTVRAAELQGWVAGGDYDRILRVSTSAGAPRPRNVRSRTTCPPREITTREHPRDVGHVVDAPSAPPSESAKPSAKASSLRGILIVGGGGREQRSAGPPP